GGKKRYKL
nr:Chain C, HIV-1 GAG PEPTIDE (GGKKRYKL - 5R MUTATION) [Human immunodeficiency virus 1]